MEIFYCLKQKTALESQSKDRSKYLFSFLTSELATLLQYWKKRKKWSLYIPGNEKDKDNSTRPSRNVPVSPGTILCFCKQYYKCKPPEQPGQLRDRENKIPKGDI